MIQMLKVATNWKTTLR